MPGSSPFPLLRFRRALLGWFDREARDLPWRGTRDPYRIWISEVMLQQTTVPAALPRFVRFLARFPTLRALARADEREVVEEWSGLGYYARARALHQAARRIADEAGGRLPRRAASLAELPGFGPYTSAAVASIAFGESVAAVDGNVIRVVARLRVLKGSSKDGALARRVRSLVAGWIDPFSPGDFNEAMMELGATICRPARPACDRCPVRFACEGFRRGKPERWPERKRPPERETLLLAAGYHVHRGEVLLRRRGQEGFLAGLLEVPSVTILEKADAERKLEAFFRRLGVRTPGLVDTGRAIRQPIASRMVEVRVFLVQGRGNTERFGRHGDLELHAADRDLPLPSLFRKVVDVAREESTRRLC